MGIVLAAHARQARSRDKRPGLARLALVFLVLATTGANGYARTDRSAQPADTRRAFASPPAATTEDCSTDLALCLSDGRFLVGATWKTPAGQSGAAHAVLLTADSGYFWFNEPSNVEVVVKTLDGCGVNGRYWFFGAGLTNLEVTITVTNTSTNETRSYTNAQGTAFQPIADAAAFEGCSAAARMSSSNPEAPFDEVAMGAPVEAPELARPDLGSGCAGGDTVLCLIGRFQVEATWQTASGQSGSARAVALTNESGYFTFFDPSNVEVIVKSLDACAIGQGQWFFAAGMTTVGVRLRVTDTLTGEVKTYANTVGTAFQPIQDTETFTYCSIDGSPPPQDLSGTWTGTITFYTYRDAAEADVIDRCLGSAAITVDLVDRDGTLTGQFQAGCAGMLSINGRIDHGSISGSLTGGRPQKSGQIRGTVSSNRIQFQTTTILPEGSDFPGGPDDGHDNNAYRSSTVDLQR